jgi:hypothetical protein
MLPGMERRLTEHMMAHCTTASEASGRSLQEVPLLKGSFGHHSASMIGGPLANSYSEESLYGNQHHPQQPHLMVSDSIHSLRGHHLHPRGVTIPVTAEIVPVSLGTSNGLLNSTVGCQNNGFSQRPPPPPEVVDQQATSILLTSSASSGALTSSSFMPVSSAATLPRSLENGYAIHCSNGGAASAASRLQNSVNSGRLLTSSPVLVDSQHTRTTLAMATMPRNMHHINGNGGGQHHWRPSSASNNGTIMASGQQIPVKKKSVTIGTFTTVVEPFDMEENLASSAV